MERSKLGCLGVGRIAAMACVGALGLTGCGGKASSSSTSMAAPHASFASAAQLEPVLLQLDVSGDAYASAVYAGQASLTAERAAIAKERETVYTTDLAVHRLKPPPAAQRAVVTYLTRSGSLVAALDRLYREPSMHAIQASLASSLSPDIAKFLDAETDLRTRLGLPKDDPWLKGQPVGSKLGR